MWRLKLTMCLKSTYMYVHVVNIHSVPTLTVNGFTELETKVQRVLRLSLKAIELDTQSETFTVRPLAIQRHLSSQ